MAAGMALNPAAMKADAASKEIEEAMKRVREAQSLISAAIEPGSKCRGALICNVSKLYSCCRIRLYRSFPDNNVLPCRQEGKQAKQALTLTVQVSPEEVSLPIQTQVLHQSRDRIFWGLF